LDWGHPAHDDFLLVSELKKPGVPLRAAFDEDLRRYNQQIQHVICLMQTLRVIPPQYPAEPF